MFCEIGRLCFVVLVFFIICPFRNLWFWSCPKPDCQKSAWSVFAKVLSRFATETATMSESGLNLTPSNLTRQGEENITGRAGLRACAGLGLVSHWAGVPGYATGLLQLISDSVRRTAGHLGLDLHLTANPSKPQTRVFGGGAVA